LPCLARPAGATGEDGPRMSPEQSHRNGFLGARWVGLSESTSGTLSVSLRKTAPVASPGGGVWRRRPAAPQPLPPLAKGASRHRMPGVEKRVAVKNDDAAERVLVDFEAAESFGRRRISEDTGDWAWHVFRCADMSESGYLCPPEFAAVVQSLKFHLGMDASLRFNINGLRFNFTYADTSLEGRVSFYEWELFASQVQKAFGLQRCVRAAARYLGTRQAEARRKARGVELFEGFSVEASLMLLMSCSNNSSSNLLENVRTALEARADPNAALTDPMHNGYSALIWLAKTPPTVSGVQVAQAMNLLLVARADPHRASGWMPFGRWTPLRFAAFMQNAEGLAVLLDCIDEDDVLGDRFQWAANENVEHVMLEEMRRDFGDNLASGIAQRSRYSMLATVLLQQYASPIAGGSLTPAGAKQLIHGDFVSGNLPRGSKANPNGTGVEGRTALMDVAEAGDVKAVKALLENVADPNRKDSSGATALHVAASVLQVDVVRALLGARANPGEVDHCGFSPWMVVGEDLSHYRSEEGYRARPQGRLVLPNGREGGHEARRELLELLKPVYSPEEILARLQQDWRSVVHPDFAGPEITLDALAQRFRLSESLFFSASIADGHGAHEGRMERPDLLLPFATILVDLLKNDNLKGDQKVLTRYLLQATMGPSSKTACAHVKTRWRIQDNRHLYRDSLTTVVTDMLSLFGKECGRIANVIEFRAKNEPSGACAQLVKLDNDRVIIPEQWRQKGQPDYVFWREVQAKQKLRYDPSWALEVGVSTTGACLALMRLEAVKDLMECTELMQVYHCSLSSLFALGYVQYAKLCNEAFQQKLQAFAKQVCERENLDIDPPPSLVGHKKLKRIKEKINEVRDELGRNMEWAGRSSDYLYYSHVFHILDAVRMSFTCNGKTTEDQVHNSMRFFEALMGCTVEQDGMCVVRYKSGFAQGVKGVGGYADVKLLVYADLGYHRAFDNTCIPLRIVGEVQLILSGFMKVKARMHLAYEVHRGSFDRDARPSSD